MQIFHSTQKPQRNATVLRRNDVLHTFAPRDCAAKNGPGQTSAFSPGGLTDDVVSFQHEKSRPLSLRPAWSVKGSSVISLTQRVVGKIPETLIKVDFT